MIEQRMPFSILMSVYEKEKADYLRQSFESIERQSMLPSEFILIADGILPAKLYSVIDEFKERLGIKLIQLNKNFGLGYALREGLKHCRNNLIARVDSDDICWEDRFRMQIEEFKKNEGLSVLGGYLSEFIHSPGDINRIKKVPLTYMDIVKYSKLRNPVNHPSVMFRKDHAMKSGSYRPMPYFEDFYLWLRMLSKGCKFANLDKPLVYFRAHPSSIQRRKGLQYAKFELRFLLTLYKERIVSPRRLFFLIVNRIPLRLMPSPLVTFFYKVFLRN